MGEPVLFQRPDINYSVRVSVFRGTVVFLRVERKSDGAVTATFRHFGFSDTGVPIPRSLVERSLESAAFLRLPAEVLRQDFFSIGLPDFIVTGDIPVCLIEVYDGTRYHSASRPYCSGNDSFGVIAEVAADIAGVDYFAN
jgi:hypothetical protein